MTRTVPPIPIDLAVAPALAMTLALILVLAVPLPAAAGEAPVVAEIAGPAPGALEMRGFYLDRSQEVTIEGTVLGRTLKWGAASDAWILDSDSRDVVWALSDAGRGKRKREMRKIEDRVRLAPGVYELYFSTTSDHRPWQVGGDDRSWFERVAAEVLGFDDYRDVLDELGIRVRGHGRTARAKDLERARRTVADGALVSLVGLPEGRLESRGFILQRSADVEIYALGELGRETGYDYGWIVDTETGRRVWRFTWEGSEPAGGADKNRRVRERLKLPAGRYAAVYVTDGSHSPQRWNAPPPHDPAFWGLTISVPDPVQRAAAAPFDYSVLPGEEPLIALDRVGSGVLSEAAFSLAAPAAVRVWAVGEGSGGEMHDRGWIADERGRKVWAMEYGRTEHAGGGRKNRLADEVVKLAPGSYRMVYVTDGSHAWGDWNDDPPFAPEAWGMALFATDPGFDRSAFRRATDGGGGDVLARIARVGDDQHRRASFRLAAPARVEIVALGEGSRGRMYDYGWIEDDAGRIVWEMRYPETDPAGGAEKNRLYRGSLRLDAGDYTVHYVTDGSHSWGDWNADPPAAAEGWGIRVTRLEGG